MLFRCTTGYVWFALCGVVRQHTWAAFIWFRFSKQECKRTRNNVLCIRLICKEYLHLMQITSFQENRLKHSTICICMSVHLSVTITQKLFHLITIKLVFHCGTDCGRWFTFPVEMLCRVWKTPVRMPLFAKVLKANCGRTMHFSPPRFTILSCRRPVSCVYTVFISNKNVSNLTHMQVTYRTCDSYLRIYTLHAKGVESASSILTAERKWLLPPRMHVK